MSEKSWLDGLTGEKFLAKIAEYETACAEQTLKALPKLGRRPRNTTKPWEWPLRSLTAPHRAGGAVRVEITDLSF